jgi:hypothetical protein
LNFIPVPGKKKISFLDRFPPTRRAPRAPLPVRGYAQNCEQNVPALDMIGAVRKNMDNVDQDFFAAAPSGVGHESRGRIVLPKVLSYAAIIIEEMALLSREK